MSDEAERTGDRPRTNPDGDVRFPSSSSKHELRTDEIGGIERSGL